MRRDRLPYLLIPLAALIAILPLLLKGPSCGHDFDFHILNWIEAATQFTHGNLHPRWAVSPAYNAGEPRFLFYPPLSWTLGALLGLILPWTWTPIAYTWLALTASGLAMHRLTRTHTTPAAALLASTLYLANPYMLFTAYERTAYAELLAAAFFPILIHAILKPRPTIPAIAIPLALLWLTNAPAAVMGTYTLALLAAVVLCAPFFPALSERVGYRAQVLPQAPRDRTPSHPEELSSSRPERSAVERPPHLAFALSTAAGTLLGLGLSAFYILPTAAERPFVQIAMVIIPGMRPDENTLFHHTGFTEDALAHDAVLHTASLIALTLLTATAAFLIAAWKKKSPNTLPLAILTAIIALLLTPLSLPIWHHAPELSFLQFPWRFLAIQAAALALATAIALQKVTLDKLLIPTTLLLAAALALPAGRLFRQPCDSADTIPARLAQFQSNAGSDPTDEYTPTPADNDALAHHAPAFWLSPTPNAPAPATSTPAPAPRDLTLTPTAPTNLTLNLRQYPDWRIDLNNHPAPTTPRDDGLIEIPLPPGAAHIHIALRTTPLERLGEALSALAALLLCAAKPLTRLLKYKQKSGPQSRAFER